LGGVGAPYLAAATFGLSLDAVSGFAAAVWPPTGIALAALILYERVVGFRPSLARLQDVLGPTGRNLRSCVICSICLSEKG
jgi:hypothetical protein